MAIQITNTGNDNILKNFVGVNTQTEELILKLYTNNVTPTLVSAADTFVEVQDVGGYQSKTLTPSNWSINAGTATTNPLFFSFQTFVGQIYGYYLVGKDSGEVIAAERFNSGPFTIANPGDTVTITVSISLI